VRLERPGAFGKGLKNPSDGALSMLCLNEKKNKKGNKRETKKWVLPTAHAQVRILAKSVLVGFASLLAGGPARAQGGPCWCGALLPSPAKLREVEPPGWEAREQLAGLCDSHSSSDSADVLRALVGT